MKLLFCLALALPSWGQMTIFHALTELTQSGAVTGSAIVWGGSAYGAGVDGVGANFSSATTVTFAHGLHSNTVHLSVKDASGKKILPKTITKTDINTAVVTFDTATSGRITAK